MVANLEIKCSCFGIFVMLRLKFLDCIILDNLCWNKTVCSWSYTFHMIWWWYRLVNLANNRSISNILILFLLKLDISFNWSIYWVITIIVDRLVSIVRSCLRRLISLFLIRFKWYFFFALSWHSSRKLGRFRTRNFSWVIIWAIR